MQLSKKKVCFSAFLKCPKSPAEWVLHANELEIKCIKFFVKTFYRKPMSYFDRNTQEAYSILMLIRAIPILDFSRIYIWRALYPKRSAVA